MTERSDWTHSLEAEQSLLGGLLIDNEAWDRVADLVTAPAFYLGDHRAIFEAIRGLIEARRPADIVTVGERLAAQDAARWKDVFAYLGALAQNTPSAINARRYAEMVRERFLLRRLYGAAQETSLAVTGAAGREVAQLLDEAQARFMEIGTARPGDGFRTMNDALAQGFAFVDEQHQRYLAGRAADVTGVSTGFADLDHETAGLHPGQLVILAARPGMGKSTLALNMTEHAARSTGRWAQFFTLEMRAREQALRTLASGSRVNLQRMFTGRLNDEEWGRISEAMTRLRGLPVLFQEQPQLTVTEVRAQARRALRERGGLSLVVVDYVQLMVAGDTDSNRANQIAEISRGLKLLAMELDVPVLLLSQLNRELEKRTNKRPMMSDLRDSGALEQDADVILFIYRDEVYNAASLDTGIAEIIIAKQRNGPVGKVRLAFRADLTRFDNLHPRLQERAA